MGQQITAQVDVVNTGKRAGEEVVQLYLSTGKLQPAVAMPVKQFKGFTKVAIAPGQTKLVTFKLTSDELYIFDASEGRYRVPTGDCVIRVGGASDNLPLSAPFTLTPTRELPDLMVGNIRTIPAFPKLGDRVLFVATVFNRGTGPSPANKALSVAFRMNGKEVAWSPNLDRSIPAGGMALVCGSDGPAGSGHCAVETATFSIQVEVDNRQLISETIESNNLSTGTIHCSFLFIPRTPGPPTAVGSPRLYPAKPNAPDRTPDF